MSTTTTTQVRHRKAAVQPVAAVSSTAKQLRVPTDKPAFTIADIRRAIPAHCFEHSLITSFGYLAADIAIVAAMMYASTFIDSIAPNSLFGSVIGPVVRHTLWIVYWAACGTVMTGAWVLGHECGHGGFAAQQWINDSVGWVVHSALLVPFFAWKISHRRHHSNTGSIEHDEVFVPTIDATKQAQTLSELAMTHEHDDGTARSLLQAIIRLKDMFIMLVFGWPTYLFMNVTGNQSYAKGVWVNHFDPNSPIFNTGSGTETDKQNARLVLISDLGILLALGVLGYLCSVFGTVTMAYTYGLPYLVMNFWLVAITFLQHTDVALPHYNTHEWDWLRGALATVDRDYGTIINHCHHHIADTHICHHLFSFLPFYHAREATEAIKNTIGDYYRMDRTPWYVALWKVYGRCDQVKPDTTNKNVFWF